MSSWYPVMLRIFMLDVDSCLHCTSTLRLKYCWNGHWTLIINFKYILNSIIYYITVVIDQLGSFMHWTNGHSWFVCGSSLWLIKALSLHLILTVMPETHSKLLLFLCQECHILLCAAFVLQSPFLRRLSRRDMPHSY